MSLALTANDLLTGVGEFPPQGAHTLKSLIPKKNRDQGLNEGLINWKNSAWQKCVNDASDMDGIDITGNLATGTGVLVQAMWAHQVMYALWKASRGHKEDTRNFEAKEHKAEYERIKARLDLLMPSGRVSKAGQGNRLVRA